MKIPVHSFPPKFDRKTVGKADATAANWIPLGTVGEKRLKAICSITL